MEPTPSSGAGSRSSGTYTDEAAETLRFEEEIHSLMRDSLIHSGIESPPPASSFTALLGLPPSQAVELLHGPQPAPPIPAGGGGEMWRQKALQVPLGCSPTFPSNAGLVERAARFSVYAAEENAARSNSGDRSPPNPKAEPEDYGDLPISGEAPRQRKRKDGERSKVSDGKAKKSKSAEDDTGGDNKLPYVHVRARRGQATDSHSLAERARREKINARMKLLQELVPGCSKITGTALVLDEIINHVQSLQRQVEILSMRLAAVNPRIDFSGLDSFLSAECGAMSGRSGMGLEQSLPWLEGSPVAGNGMMRRQSAWHVDVVQLPPPQGPSVCWERGEDATPMPMPAPATQSFLSTPATSLFVYDSNASVSLPSQLKTEL